MTAANIQVAIVIKSRIYREGIARHFQDSPGITLSGMYDSTAQLLPNLGREFANVVVLECLSGGLQPVMNKIRLNNNDIKIVTIILDLDMKQVRECMSSGVDGFVTSNDGIEDLCHCINNVHAGRISYPAEITKQFIHDVIQKPAPHRDSREWNAGLTCRQHAVIELLESGHSNKQIARELGIELATVKNHVHQILERLNVKSRCQAAATFRKLQGL